ncbi:glycine betaine/L-proline ABC transporter ATP-binding protein [Seohaeicola nanhaiensis]|uniref:Glycine betaine/L-proline ABC transporter ATP-binding protein n=1 Tax=Seohaeicola nanhaiensis TaxID=1387282 RepID=A0ABV9KJP8_9RHOB
MSEDATPAIACRNLWQVFGPNAGAELASALAANGGDAAAAAAELRDKGLIPAVQDVGFDVRPGELFVIMGLSGSGKSTLVRGLSRLLDVTAGDVRIQGEDIAAGSKARLIELRRKKLGMVFQHFGLFPHMSVLDNVAYPLRVQGIPRARRHAKAREVIELVGLGGRESAFPRTLSGGQRQRVGIARSLVGDCEVWFLDEPFSALDPLIRRQLQDEFLQIRAKLNTTIVFITHDIAEALKLADRIAIMRDGEVIQIGTPAQIVLNPVDSYVREFARDVAKGRHARVASVMKPASGITGDGPALREGMTLDAALATCVAAQAPVPVTDGAGKIVGQVDPADLVSALHVDDR